MSANFNSVTLAGNLTRDPEMNYAQSGTAIVNFDMAVNNPARDEEVLFIKCVAFGKLAEVIAQYTTKGKNILVNGRLVLDRWETNEGEKCSQIKLFVATMQLLGGSGSASSDTAETSAPTGDITEYDI